MDVTKENFDQAAAELEELLPSCEFVAFDEEMTGITLPGQPERIDDVPAQRYQKMRNVAMRYNIIQFGVCLFHAEDGGNRYIARPYNFYLFPESGPVNMEASSVGFLNQHGMDWNKWTKEGIPYLSHATAEKVRASMFPKDVPERKDSGGKLTLTKKADIEATDNAIAAMKAWLADESKKEETEFAVMTTNPYIRKFLYGKIEEDYPNLLAESRPVPGTRLSSFVVLRLTESQRAEREAKARGEKLKAYSQKVGFYRVFKALMDSKKPLVGHNCMYDILFMLSHFQGPLPEHYSSLKQTFKNLCPLMLDTKTLATTAPFKFVPPRPVSGENGDVNLCGRYVDNWQNTFNVEQTDTQVKFVYEEKEKLGSLSGGKLCVDCKGWCEGQVLSNGDVKFTDGGYWTKQDGARKKDERFGSTALGEVFKVFVEEARAAKAAGADVTEVAFAPKFERYENDASAAHEAAYDAYMTGYAFAHMAKDALSPTGIAACGGRTPMFRALSDFNFAGDDGLLGDMLFIHVQGLKGRNVATLRGALAEIKVPGEEQRPTPINFRWIDDDSAFAELPKACASGVEAMLAQCRSANGFTLTPSAEWFAAQTAKFESAAASADVAEPPLKRLRTA